MHLVLTAVIGYIQGEHTMVSIRRTIEVRPDPAWLNYAYVGAEWSGCEYPACSAEIM